MIQVEDFRYDTLGIARSDRETLTLAFDAWQAIGSGKLSAEAGRIYNLGNISTVGISEIFSIEGLRSAVFDGNGAYVVLNSQTLGVQPYLFVFRDCRNVVVQNLRVTDYGTDLTVNWRGVYAFCLMGDQSNKSLFNFTLDNINIDRGVSFLVCAGNLSIVDGITVLPNCQATSVYYGLLFQEAGANVDASLLTIDCLRSYFAYGVRGHRIRINCIHSGVTRGAEAMCLIKRYQQDTGDIDLTITVSGTTASFGNIVKLEHEPVSGTGIGTIDNVSVSYNLAPTLAMTMSNAACDLFGEPHGSKTRPLCLASFAAGVEETTTTANIWKRVSIVGSFSVAPGEHVLAKVKPNKPADIAVAPNVSLNPYRCNTKGNVVFRTANNREFRAFKGNLTAANAITIDLSGFDNVSTVVGINALLAGGTSGSAAQDRTYFELNAFLTIPSGGPIAINTTPSPVLNSSGVAATVGSLTASGKVLTIPVTGSAYNGANAFALIETIYRDQVPS